jgi:hypothetical protein
VEARILIERLVFSWGLISMNLKRAGKLPAAVTGEDCALLLQRQKNYNISWFDKIILFQLGSLEA